MNKTKLKVWLNATRLRTLPLAVSGIVLSGLLAYSQKQFHSSIFALALFTTLLLQILSNLANDYGDFDHGTDNKNRVGPERAVQSGVISPNEMKYAVYIVGFLAFCAGIFLLIASLNSVFNYIFILFLIVGIVAIGAAIKYTIGKKPFGYKGFGDIMVFLFFGIAAVWGTFFLLTSKIQWLVLLPAAAVGLLSSGVLNINNMRDIVNDKNSAKITLAVKLGKKGSKIYHLLLIVISILLFGLYLSVLGKIWVLVSLVIPVTPLLIHCIKVIKNKEPYKLDSELKRLSLSTLFISLWVGIGLVL